MQLIYSSLKVSINNKRKVSGFKLDFTLWDTIYKHLFADNLIKACSVDEFEYLTDKVEQQVLNATGDKKFAYVEAEYFGGEGGKIAIIWNNNGLEQILPFGQDRINQVLKDFGVTAYKGQDEFLTLGFGLRRHTREWIEDAG